MKLIKIKGRQSSQGRLKRGGGFFIELKGLVGLGYLKKKGKHVLCEGATDAKGKGKEVGEKSGYIQGAKST